MSYLLMKQCPSLRRRTGLDEALRGDRVRNAPVGVRRDLTHEENVVAGEDVSDPVKTVYLVERSTAVRQVSPRTRKGKADTHAARGQNRGRERFQGEKTSEERVAAFDGRMARDHAHILLETRGHRGAPLRPRRAIRVREQQDLAPARTNPEIERVLLGTRVSVMVSDTERPYVRMLDRVLVCDLERTVCGLVIHHDDLVPSLRIHLRGQRGETRSDDRLLIPRRDDDGEIVERPVPSLVQPEQTHDEQEDRTTVHRGQ